MIKVQNLKTEIPKDKESKMNYADLIVVVCNQESKSGFSVDEMKKRFRIVEVAETQSKELSFEDEDFKNLKKLVSEMRWGMPHIDIVGFSEHINELEVK